MNITKKAALRNASVCDAWGLRGPASAIKSLSDERETLQAENEKLRAALKEARRTALEEAFQAVTKSSQRSIAVAAIRALQRAALGEKE